MLCYGSGGNSLLLVNEHWGTREGDEERMESGMKDQVQGRARARPLNITTAERASGRREREGGTRRRRQFIFALKVTPEAAARCPFVSRSLSLPPSACKRIDGVVCMDGVGSRRRRRASLEFMDVGESERARRRTDRRGRTDHYVEWPGGNMKAKSLSLHSAKVSKRDRGEGGPRTACVLACTMLNASPQYMCSSLRVVFVLIDGASSSSFQKPIKEHRAGGASK